MSTTKALTTIAILASGPCTTTNPSPEPANTPSYQCEHIFDTACRFEADVEIEGGSMDVNTFNDGAGHFGSVTTVRDVAATVLLTDRNGEHPDRFCDVVFDARFSASFDNMGTRTADFEITALSLGDCPVDCPWFLPDSGVFLESYFGSRPASGTPFAEQHWETYYASESDGFNFIDAPFFESERVEAQGDGIGGAFFAEAALEPTFWQAPIAAPEMLGDVDVECF